MINPHPLAVEPPHAAFWRRSDRRRQAVRPSVHAELVVLFATSGRARYFVDGQIYPLAPGSLLFAWAGAAHFLVSDSDDFDMWVALISERFVEALPAVPRVQGEGAAEVRALSGETARALDDLAKRVHGMPEAFAPGLGWWLVQAWAAWRAAPQGQARALHPAVDRAARLLREAPDIEIEELAREAGLSPGRLGQVFRREMGQGIVAFRTAEKLARADLLVRVEGRDFLNAALESGFGSYSQYFRAFQARHGATPRAYYRRT